MTEPVPQPLSERLLQQEKTSPELRQRYEKELEGVMQYRLSPLQRWLGWFSFVTFGAIIVGLIFRHSRVPADLWPFLIAGLAAMTALEAWILYALLRPSVHRLRDRAWSEAIGGIGLFAMAAALIELAERFDDQSLQIRLLSLAAIFLGTIAVSVILFFQRRDHLETRTKLLELELHLAEMARRMDEGAKR